MQTLHKHERSRLSLNGLHLQPTTASVTFKTATQVRLTLAGPNLLALVDRGNEFQYCFGWADPASAPT